MVRLHSRQCSRGRFLSKLKYVVQVLHSAIFNHFEKNSHPSPHHLNALWNEQTCFDQEL